MGTKVRLIVIANALFTRVFRRTQLFRLAIETWATNDQTKRSSPFAEYPFIGSCSALFAIVIFYNT